MSNVTKEFKATVIVTRDEMVYMVQRVVANMEEKMLSQLFYDKALAGIEKEVTSIDTTGILYTNRFISVPVTVSIEKVDTESDITSLLASRIYNSITNAYKVASVLVATEKYESIAGVNGDGDVITVSKGKNGEASFESSLMAVL